jgi:hypothetical protein
MLTWVARLFVVLMIFLVAGGMVWMIVALYRHNPRGFEQLADEWYIPAGVIGIPIVLFGLAAWFDILTAREVYKWGVRHKARVEAEELAKAWDRLRAERRRRRRARRQAEDEGSEPVDLDY